MKLISTRATYACGDMISEATRRHFRPHRNTGPIATLPYADAAFCAAVGGFAMPRTRCPDKISRFSSRASRQFQRYASSKSGSPFAPQFCDVRRCQQLPAAALASVLSNGARYHHAAPVMRGRSRLLLLPRVRTGFLSSIPRVAGRRTLLHMRQSRYAPCCARWGFRLISCRSRAAPHHHRIEALLQVLCSASRACVAFLLIVAQYDRLS